MIKGQADYEKFKAGKRLTRGQAMKAHCYECNGFEAVDCQGTDCAMYQYMHYKGKKKVKSSKNGEIDPLYSIVS